MLRERTPHQVVAVQSVDRLADNVTASSGDRWDSRLAAVFEHAGSYVVYDLGSIQKVRSAWLIGDHNDAYIVEGSSDGQRFELIWEAGPTDGPGLQARSTTSLNASARFVRISARDGDRNYSLAEVQLFSGVPSSLPAAIEIQSSLGLGVLVRGRMLNLAAAMVLLVLFASRDTKRWLMGLLGFSIIVATAQLVVSLREAWPLEPRDVSLARWAIATTCLVTIIRGSLTGRFPPSERVVLRVLGLCGVLGFFAFFNFGHPQFYNHKLDKTTYVHLLDLKQYYPMAKYFPELGYRGGYEADIAAYLDDTGLAISSIAHTPFRDLHTHRMSTVGAQREGILAIRARFSSERWEQYKKDARYFRDAMGVAGYVDSFHDFGGNATPVWVAMAYVIFNSFDASDVAFSVTALADPLLLLIALFAIARTFGLHTALLGMVLFGANDFIMYGTNWGGSTLRHDWMAYLAFGACALRREHWRLAGVFLAMSASIRAFPALALLGATLPALWLIAAQTYTSRKLPTLHEIKENHSGIIMLALASLVVAFSLIAVTSLLLGTQSWADWSTKVAQLSADPHANHIGLRGLIAGWDVDQALILRDRMPLYLSSMMCLISLVVIASRRMRPEQSAVLALVLVPVIFYPANYYIHLIWLLPLTVTEIRSHAGTTTFDRTGIWVIGSLLALCAGQYFSVLETDRGPHFYSATVLLFAAISSILIAHTHTQLIDWMAEPNSTSTSAGSSLPRLAHRPSHDD